MRIIDNLKSRIKTKIKPKEKTLSGQDGESIKRAMVFDKAIKEDDSIPIIQESKPLGLKSQLEEVSNKLDILTKRDIRKEQKEFRLPYKIKRQLKKLALKNKIMVIYLTTNRSMIPIVAEIKDGFIAIDGKPHECTTDFIFLWKGKYPAIVIKEWDITPVGTSDYYKAVEEKRTPDPIAVGIRMIENKENIMKNKVSPKALIWIVIGVAIVAYALFAGGK